MNNFTKRYSVELRNALNVGSLVTAGHLTTEEVEFLNKIKVAWDFYEGYHWEGVDDLDTPQITFNYCRAFVNKYVSFEFSGGFSIKTSVALDNKEVTVDDKKTEETIDTEPYNNLIETEEVEDYVKTGERKEVVRERTTNEFLTQVWNDNKKSTFLETLGQMKSITGDAWVKIQYDDPKDMNDPFEEYPNGRIRVTVTPTQYCFPTFNEHDKDKLESLLIMYPIRKEVETGLLFKRTSETTIIYKENWTKDEILVFEDENLIDKMDNPYGFIPFVQIRNFPIAGRVHGVSDLDDIIPLNVELNTKRSDISEIIDYHSAPITLVYGAKIGNLEKGANKVWGGLPKDSRVENLALQGDLAASKSYTADVKTSMCEIGAIPEINLGGAGAISNTSGVALQYMNLPLIDRTKVKKESSQNGLQTVNKMILYIALHHGLIEKPENVSMSEFLYNEVDIPDTLPKDELIELQKIQQELAMGLECRHGALERLGVEDIPNKLREIDEERREFPELFNPSLQALWYQNGMSNTNAGGMLNGQTPDEQMRKNLTGQNGGAEET